jgi:hypothetical protein
VLPALGCSLSALVPLALMAPLPLSRAQGATPTPTAFMGVRPDAEFQPLQRGVPIVGELEDARSVRRFAVFAAANDVISFGMFPEPISALVPHFEVYAPNGEGIAIRQRAPSPCDRLSRACHRRLHRFRTR